MEGRVNHPEPGEYGTFGTPYAELQEQIAELEARHETVVNLANAARQIQEQIIAQKDAELKTAQSILRDIVQNTDAGYDVLASAAIDDAREFLKCIRAELAKEKGAGDAK